MMTTVCVVFAVGFTMENLCASAQTHGPTQIPYGSHHGHQCTTAQFMCNNRECISLAFRCDGDNDCADRSDEENCRRWLATVSLSIYTSPSQIGCRSDQFQCRIKGGCIPAEYQCDKSDDCLDGTDETGCDTYTSPSQFRCQSDQFQCSTGDQCVLARYQCDGDKDCLDNSDESGCNSPTSAASTISTTAPLPTTPSSSSASTWQDSTQSASSHVQTEKDKEYGYLDKINTMVAVIVGGVVITAIVISVAVVLVLKKRRTAVKTEYIAAKIEEHYDMPNDSCSPSRVSENVRTSNLYDFIPDPGDCSPSNYTSLEYTAAKENDYVTPVKESDYLTPVMESKEAPYMTPL